MNPTTAPARSMRPLLLALCALLGVAIGAMMGCVAGEAAVPTAPEGGPALSAVAASSAGGEAGAAPGALASIPRNTLATDELWHDGLAEVSHYAMTRSQYGRVRSFDGVLLVVKEEFDPVQMVKADRASEGTVPVLKMNWLFDIPTDNYPYHHATNVFVDRNDPFVLHKEVSVSTEWCGTVTKELRAYAEPAELAYATYYQSEGAGTDRFAWPPNALSEEQLLFAVRTLDFAHVQETEVSVLERLVTSHHTGTRFREATLRVEGRETVEDAAGASHDTWHVRVDLGRGSLDYWVAADFPHRLVAHEGPGGLTMRLRESSRYAYWR